MLKQDSLGLCLQTGTDQKGKEEQRPGAKNVTGHLRAYIVSLILSLGDFRRDQSLEYLKKKKRGIFGAEGSSCGTLEGKCFAVFSFCQAPRHCSNFTMVCCVPLRQT